MTNRTGILLVGVVVAVVVYAGLTAGGSLLGSGGGDGPGAGTAGEVVATHTTYHLDRQGRPTVVGEVVNRRGTAIAGATVTVTFYHGGEVVGRKTERAIRSPVPSDGRSPFDVHLPSSPERKVDDYAVEVSYDPYDGPVYAGLSAENVEVARESQDAVELTGEVRNDGDRTVEAVQVVAMFYSENGSLVGVRTTRPSPPGLSPGETGVFRVTFRTLGDVPSLAREYDTHRVLVVRTDAGSEGTSARFSAGFRERGSSTGERVPTPGIRRAPG